MSTLPHHLTGISLACDGHTELSADEVSAYAGETVNALQGLFGPGVMATVDVAHDDDPLQPWDWESAPGGGAVIPLARGHWGVKSAIAHDAPEWLQRALERYEVDGGTREGDYGLRTFARYARLRGYAVTVETLQGMTPSGWMDVIAIHPANVGSGVEAWREYWDEGGFIVTVTVGDVDYLKSVSTVGYLGIESLVGELLGEGVDSRRASLRAAS